MPKEPLGEPSARRALQTSRSEAMYWLTWAWLEPERLPAAASPLGRARSDPAKPSHSRPTVGALASVVPVAASLMALPVDRVKVRRAGNSRVLRFTCAPL